MTERATVAVFFAFVVGASLLAMAARRFAADDDLPSLEGWALAGRRLGGTWTWLILGGTVFTAYTFIAVPGLVFEAGAFGSFPLAYTVIVCPLMFVLLPRMWSIAQANGYVTAGDFVRGRYGSPSLALVVALTGILATMPYLALQLVGIRAVLTAGGTPGASGDLAMIVVFAVLAVSTYHHGLRAPALLSLVKTIVIFGSLIAAWVFVLRSLGGPGTLFHTAASHRAQHAPPGTSLSSLAPGQSTAYATLALGSALALPMYPHVLTAAFAASGPNAIRRACVALPAWSGALGLFGLLGVAALAVGVHTPPGRTEAALPLLVDHLLPPTVAGLVLGAVALGALVPAAVMSIAAATTFVRNVYVECFDRAATPKRQVRIARAVSITAKAGAVVFVLGLKDQDAINLQLLGGVWILQTAPAVVLGLYARRLHHHALLAGWCAGMAVGTVLVVRRGFSSVVPLGLGNHTMPVYAGLAALLLNLVVAIVATVVLDKVHVPRGRDLTSLPPLRFGRPRPETGAAKI